MCRALPCFLVELEVRRVLRRYRQPLQAGRALLVL
jgi:hypothetical protein